MSLYKQTGSRFWWYKFTVDGVSYRESTRTADRAEAELTERKARTKVEAIPIAVRQSPKHILGDCYTLDEARVEAKKTKQISRGDLRQHWRNLLRFFGTDCSLDKVTYQRMTEYVVHRRKSARGQTIIREIAALRRGLELAQAYNWIPTVPIRTPDINRDPKDPKRVGKVHSPEFLKAWLNELSRKPRDIFVFALYTGLRLHEVRRVRPSHVTAPTSHALATLRVDGKNKSRVIPIPAPAYALIQQNLEGRSSRDDSPVFSQQKHITAVRNATRRLGYEQNVTMRDMRKTWATMADRLGKDRASVQTAMGHSTMNTTEIYLEAADMSSMSAVACTTESWANAITGVQSGAMPGPGHSSVGIGNGQQKSITEKSNENTGLVVSAVGIEPTTYGLRVLTDGGFSIPDMSNYAQLVASGDSSKQFETVRCGHTFGHTQGPMGAQNADPPWADELDVELVG